MEIRNTASDIGSTTSSSRSKLAKMTQASSFLNQLLHSNQMNETTPVSHDHSKAELFARRESESVIEDTSPQITNEKYYTAHLGAKLVPRKIYNLPSTACFVPTSPERWSRGCETQKRS